MSLLVRAPERRPRAEDVVRALAGAAPLLPDQDGAATTRIAAEDIPETLVQPAEQAPRPGIRTGGLRTGVIIGALGVTFAGIGIAAGATIGRGGITVDTPVGRTAAAAGLAVAVGAVIVCFALAVLSLWAARNRDRAGVSVARVALAVMSVLAAAACSAAIVWTSNAWLTAGVATLWRNVQ